jgi:hypothetical protein
VRSRRCQPTALAGATGVMSFSFPEAEPHAEVTAGQAAFHPSLRPHCKGGQALQSLRVREVAGLRRRAAPDKIIPLEQKLIISI